MQFNELLILCCLGYFLLFLIIYINNSLNYSIFGFYHFLLLVSALASGLEPLTLG